MKREFINKKDNYIYSIIACIGLFFSCVYIIQAYNEGKMYDILASKKTVDIESKLGQKVTKIQHTIEANKAIQQQEYKKALQIISGNTSEEYYNRGTIQTLLAYQNALENSISGLQNAQIFVAQAQQSFDIAKQLSKSKNITHAINKNKTTITSLSALVDIKTCYGIGQTIITEMKDIITITKNIKNVLNQEEIYISKNASSIDTICYEKLRYIVDTSKEQVALFQGQIQKNTDTYISDLAKRLEDPLRCIDTPYENILPSISKGKQGLQQYPEQHITTIEALKSNNTQDIQELCKQSKNDAEINQEIESAVQELLQKLEDNKMENQEQKKSTKEVKYKNFFDENEKKTLQEIQKTNQSRINTILDIRGKGNYSSERYINTIFNQFYGNSGDFIDLHK
ncbi:MAG TPA: hypothetical protein PKC87_03705 [Candidatus Absconditabacterales bacterium]|nr:hypothetical protein [Candidatus Absconditabacterales bacterium]